MNTMDEYHFALTISLMNVIDRAEQMAEEALQALDDLCDLMTIRADYEWLKSQVTPAFPLGISNWVDVQIVKRAAKAAGLDHIADALIEELSLQGLGIDLGDLDRARA